MSAELYNAVSLVVVALIVAGLAWSMNRTQRLNPFAYAEASARGASVSERVEQENRELHDEVERLQAAFGAVMEDNRRLATRVKYLEDRIAGQDDQIRALEREVEDWRRQARSK